MDYLDEQPTFEIQPVIEQTPFESYAVQAFFARWCRINDSIVPRMVSRQIWEQRGKNSILAKRLDGQHTLYLPKDLKLWEMVGVMEAVDHDTFAAKPERQEERRDKIFALGKTFQNAGVYIAKRLDAIDQGKAIARALAEEFYDYGQLLMIGKRLEKPTVFESIEASNIPSETEEVDRFLAGDNLYKSRQARAEKLSISNPAKKDELYETERRKTLAQFFRIAEKAFELRRETDRSRQSDTPIHSAFLKKVERAMIKKIETPKTELIGSIFRRGMELLQKNMPFDTLPGWVKSVYLHWDNGEKTLREALRIDQLKTELEDIRYWGNTAEISVKEREIADKIQIAVSSFPYKLLANNPSKMVVNQYINCVGASSLGGALMKEAGLHYLVGDVPEHSILLLVTSDGQVEWRDMLNAKFNEDLTDEIIAGNNKDGSPLTVSDIVEFSRNPQPEGLMFDIKSGNYRNKLKWVREEQRQYVTVFEPEYGQQIQILNNMGSVFYELGNFKEAIEAYRQAIALDPKYIYPYDGLGNSLLNLDRDEEAIEAYRQAIALDPKHANPYYGLGSALYDLGRKEESVKAYRRFIKLADKEKDADLITWAEKIIAELH